MNLQFKVITLFLCLGLMMTSCVKEEISPTDINSDETESGIDNTGTTIQTFEFQSSLSSGEITININKTSCAAGGYTLTVESPDVDLTNGDYTINWYQNTQQVLYFTGQSLECVCGFGIRIEVLDETDTIQAKDSLDIPSC
jgi:hypothetical protein